MNANNPGELDSSLAGLSAKLSNAKPNVNTIENLTKLINLVKNGRTNDLSTVNEAINKANFEGLDKEKFLWLTCKSIKEPKNVEEEEARTQMLSELKREEKRRTEELAKDYAIQSALIILLEFLTVWHIWDLIKSAKSKMERCEEKFEEIERLLAQHKIKSDQLKRCIKEYSHIGHQKKREEMLDLTSELASDLRGTKRMIGNVQVKLKEENISIGNIAKPKLMFYLNFTPVIASAYLLYKYWGDLDKYFKIVLVSVTVGAFAILPFVNNNNYSDCQQILGKLRSDMEMIEQFDDELQQIEEIIKKAQGLVECDKPPEETS